MEIVESVILLLVGLTVFMVGMDMMSAGLKKAAGKGLRGLFRKIEKNRLAGFGIGASVTAIIQSSSATSVMVIGFLNAGIMTLLQGMCIMMGAYVGTSVTGLIVSLGSFKITPYLIAFAFIGLVMTFVKDNRVKNIGTLVSGLGLLFFGLETMSSVFSGDNPVKDAFEQLFQNVNFPLLLLLIGAVFTAIVQSSSATSGIVIMLVGQGAIPVTSGLYLVIGATVGAVLITIISSLSGCVNAKRLGVSCMIMRFICALIGTGIVWAVDTVSPNAFGNALLTIFGNAALAVAMFNFLYNLVFGFITIPFGHIFAHIGEKLIKDKGDLKKARAVNFIDDKMLEEPIIAKSQAKKEIISMMGLALTNLKRGFDRVITQDPSNDQILAQTEERIDSMNEILTGYLIKLSPLLDGAEGQRVGSFFHVINDVERIGDHANNFYEMSVEMQEHDLKFSDIAVSEFNKLFDIIVEMSRVVPKVFDEKDATKLHHLHELEEQTDELSRSLSDAHYQRIKTQTCKVELSPYYTSFVSNLERVADHLVNIGYSIVDPTGADLEEK